MSDTSRQSIAELHRLKKVSGPSRLLSIVTLVFIGLLAAGMLFLALWRGGEIDILTDRGLVTGFEFRPHAGGPPTAGPVVTTVPVGELGWARLAILFWAGLPVGLLIWGLLGARRCFLGLANGRFFAAETILGLRTFAWGVVGSILAEPFARTIASAFLPVTTDFGVFGVGFNGDKTTLLLFAGAVVMVSHALSRAAEVARENQQFV